MILWKSLFRLFHLSMPLTCFEFLLLEMSWTRPRLGLSWRKSWAAFPWRLESLQESSGKWIGQQRII